MGQAVTNLTEAVSSGIQLAPANRSEVSSVTKEIIVLGLVLAVLQVIDGVFTGIGVSHFGTEIEGNILIRSLMEQIGFVEALIVVKGFALVVIVAICSLAGKVKWLGFAMRGIAVIYIAAAVIPWSYIIAKHIL
jgi:hypothetical protein